MAIGDKSFDKDGYGLEEIKCDECFGPDPNCICCAGEGIMFRLIAPEHEIAAIFTNIFSQMPERKH